MLIISSIELFLNAQTKWFVEGNLIYNVQNLNTVMLMRENGKSQCGELDLSWEIKILQIECLVKFIYFIAHHERVL